MAKPTISNCKQSAFGNHWKLGGVMDSGEIFWQAQKSSSFYLHSTIKKIFPALKICICLNSQKHTHTQGVGFWHIPLKTKSFYPCGLLQITRKQKEPEVVHITFRVQPYVQDLSSKGRSVGVSVNMSANRMRQRGSGPPHLIRSLTCLTHN